MLSSVFLLILFPRRRTLSPIYWYLLRILIFLSNWKSYPEYREYLLVSEMNSTGPASGNHKSVFYIASFVEDQLSRGVWVYSWAVYFIPFIRVPVFVVMPCCFDYYSFAVLCEVRKLSRSFLLCCVFFFLKIALAILGLLWFHISFRIIYSSFGENVIGIFIDIALNP